MKVGEKGRRTADAVTLTAAGHFTFQVSMLHIYKKKIFDPMFKILIMTGMNESVHIFTLKAYITKKKAVTTLLLWDLIKQPYVWLLSIQPGALAHGRH